MAMKELPALAGGRSRLVGTYFAEQVSSATYDLLSVAHPQPQHRSGAQEGGSSGSGATRSSTAPSSPRRGPSQKRRYEVGAKCTLLPALQDSFTGLLHEGGGGAIDGSLRSGSTTTDGALSELGERRELRAAEHADRLRQSAARLARGERCFAPAVPSTPRRPATTGDAQLSMRRRPRPMPAATPTDEDIVRALTRPLTCFTPPPAAGAISSPGQPASPQSERGGLFGDVGFPRRPNPVKRHTHYRDAFDAGLAGTEIGMLPLRFKAPLTAIRGRVHGHIAAKDRLRDPSSFGIFVLPEDPVSAYFAAHGRSKGPADEAPMQAVASTRGPPPSIRKDSGDAVSTWTTTSGGSSAAGVGDADGAGPIPHPHHQRLTVVMEAGALTVAAEAARQGAPAAEEVQREVAHHSTSHGHLRSRGSDHVIEAIDAVNPRAKITPSRREACQLARIFFFGSVGNERRKGQDKEKIFQEAIGAPEQVKAVFTFWERMEASSTSVAGGSVDLQDFRSFAERYAFASGAAGGAGGGSASIPVSTSSSTVQLLAATAAVAASGTGLAATAESAGGERRASVRGLPRRDDSASFGASAPEETGRLVSRMCDRIGACLNPRKTVTVEDVLRILWPCAGLEHLRQMRAWREETLRASTKWRVPTPQVLPEEELEALVAVFKYYDKDKKEEISLDELVIAGLLERDVAQRIIVEGNASGDGCVDVGEFCDIMCPAGFRAKETTERATTQDGTAIVYDKRLGGWRFDSDAEQAAGAGSTTALAA